MFSSSYTFWCCVTDQNHSHLEGVRKPMHENEAKLVIFLKIKLFVNRQRSYYFKFSALRYHSTIKDKNKLFTTKTLLNESSFHCSQLGHCSLNVWPLYQVKFVLLSSYASLPGFPRKCCYNAFLTKTNLNYFWQVQFFPKAISLSM